jgi:histidyl-tRNA synthetase
VRGEDRQLCGGGRYDDLVVTLGGKNDTTAAGFSYGLERLRHALQSESKLPGDTRESVEVLVIPVSSDDHGYAIEVAERLRNEGLDAEIDVRGRSVKSNFQYADKQGMRFAMVVGSAERPTGEVILKQMATRVEQRMTINDAINKVKKTREDHAK